MKKSLSFSTAASGSLRIRPTAIPILVIGVLSFLGFTLPASAGTFTLTLTKNTPQVIHSVTSGAGRWIYTVTVRGRVSLLSLNIKNSAPGAADYCSHAGLRQPKGNTVIVTDPSIGLDPIPAAVASACGNHWTDIVMSGDTDNNPLAFLAYIEAADPAARVDIQVDYPNP